MAPTPTAATASTAFCQVSAVHELTPTELIGAVRAARARAAAAEVEVWRLALAWADAHPALPGEQAWHAAQLPLGAGADASAEDVEWFAIPAVAWDAPAAFAAANAMSTTAGRSMLRDALVVRHRLPRLHRRVLDGQVPTWRARRVAQAVLGQPSDVVALVDLEVAGVAESISVAALDKVVDTALLRLHAEEREQAQLDALDARHATLDMGSVNHTGVADMHLRADLPDLVDLDRTLSAVAHALETQALATGDLATAFESLSVRRARAIGILADPAAALALLQGDPAWAEVLTRRRVELVVHLSDTALVGVDPLTHSHQSGPALLTQTVQGWCGRPGTAITVSPLLDLASPIGVPDPQYRPSPTQVRHVRHRDRHCVFPHCGRPAERCDTDHVVPWRPDPPPGVDGQTHTDNLAPLCRHHHRLKTHAGWRLRVLVPGTYLWTDPHGQRFVRTSDGGTHDVTHHVPAAVRQTGPPG